MSYEILLSTVLGSMEEDSVPDVARGVKSRGVTVPSFGNTTVSSMWLNFTLAHGRCIPLVTHVGRCVTSANPQASSFVGATS